MSNEQQATAPVNDPDSPVRRMTMAVVAGVAILVAAALVYFFVVSKETAVKFNGASIISAAHAYTRDLGLAKKPIPPFVSLDDLVSLHYLRPEEAEAFHGMKATIFLTKEDKGPQYVIMRVHLPDGGELELLGDGSVQQAAR